MRQERGSLDSMTIEDEFLRVLSPSLTKSAKWIPNGAVHFGTDVGLRREENQDRVAVLKWNDGSLDSPGFLAVAVVDGMGGMIDGARCASLTLSAYFYSLHTNGGAGLMDRVKQAAQYANKRVYDAYRGNGGATLSSIVVSATQGSVTLNVGDSRIYGLTRATPEWSVQRLSIDDTFKEAFHSEGNGLIQYIGVGSGLRPHVSQLDPGISELVLTTDGAHYVEPDIFERILSTAPDLKARTDRSIALARWLGGHDNITVAAVDLSKARSQAEGSSDRITSLFNPGTDLSFLLLPAPEQRAHASDRPADALSPALPVKTIRTRRKTAQKKLDEDKKHEQLAIDIEISSRKDLDADS